MRHHLTRQVLNNHGCISLHVHCADVTMSSPHVHGSIDQAFSFEHTNPRICSTTSPDSRGAWVPCRAANLTANSRLSMHTALQASDTAASTVAVPQFQSHI